MGALTHFCDPILQAIHGSVNYPPKIPCRFLCPRRSRRQRHGWKPALRFGPRAACALGVIAAGGTPAELAAAESYGIHLARAFQIRDDILDITATEAELGKPIGSDARNEKPTYASVLGVEAAEELVLAETRKAKAAMTGAFAGTAFFDTLAGLLAVRRT